MRASTSYKGHLDEELQDDELAALYLREALFDSDPDLFMLMLGDLARARVGGMEALLLESGMNQEELRRTFLEQGPERRKKIGKIHQSLRLQSADEHAEDRSADLPVG